MLIVLSLSMLIHMPQKLAGHILFIRFGCRAGYMFACSAVTHTTAMEYERNIKKGIFSACLFYPFSIPVTTFAFFSRNIKSLSGAHTLAGDFVCQRSSLSLSFLHLFSVVE